MFASSSVLARLAAACDAAASSEPVTRAVYPRGAPSGTTVEVLDAELRLPAKPESVARAVLTVAYRVRSPRRPPVILWGFATATGDPRDAAALLAATGAPGDPLLVPARGAALAPLTADPAVRLHADAPRLDGAPGDVVWPRDLAAAVERYRPGRRVITRFPRAGGGVAYAKTYPDGRDRTVWGHLTGLRDAAPALPQPDLLGHGPVSGTVWTAGTGGDPLPRLLRSAGAAQLIDQAAAGLAAVHASGVPAADAVAPGDAAVETRRRARKIAVALPDLADTVARAADAVADTAPEDAERVTTYGDFHPGQIRVVDGRAVFFDLDGMRRGDPVADLAEFIAHLTLLLPARRAAGLARGLVHGYVGASGRDFPPAALTWHLRVQLLQRAYGAVKGLGPGWERVAADAALTAARLDGHAVADLCPAPRPAVRPAARPAATDAAPGAA